MRGTRASTIYVRRHAAIPPVVPLCLQYTTKLFIAEEAQKGRRKDRVKLNSDQISDKLSEDKRPVPLDR